MHGAARRDQHQQRQHGDGIARGVEGERADRVGADVLRDEGRAPDERGENGENNLTHRILFHIRGLLWAFGGKYKSSQTLIA